MSKRAFAFQLTKLTEALEELEAGQGPRNAFKRPLISICLRLEERLDAGIDALVQDVLRGHARDVPLDGGKPVGLRSAAKKPIPCHRHITSLPVQEETIVW
eukprot:2500947-Pyramimonas_sp.AAC.1